jgi:hypothetical protein
MVDPSHPPVGGMIFTTWLWLLGAGWGLVVAAPIMRRATRLGPRARVSGLRMRATPSARGSGVRARIAAALRARAGDAGVRVVASLWSRRRARHSELATRRELPVALDLLGVAVNAGCTPYLAVEVAARWAPASLAVTFADVLRACALGLDFEAALESCARAQPALRPLTEALLASDRFGVPVGPALARLADEDRRALRRAAETNARRIPVRLLFPLVFLVLPAFVVLTVVPGVAAGLGRL